jgi:Fur family peroxide stress response transcriptional regulator
MVLPAEEIERRLNEFMEACRKADVKITFQRIEIFREVASTEEHPDAESVYERVRKRIPTISIDTVYRTLAFLEKLKLVSKVRTLSDRARFDANTHPHHHFVCSRCGLIKDFQSPEAIQFHVPAEVLTWGSVHSVHVELSGICSACAAGTESDT